MSKKKQEFANEEWDFDFIGKPHPLLIPSVVFKIFEHMSYSELKERRCVCSQWEYEASRLLQPKSLIRFAKEDKIVRYMKELPCINYTCVSFEFGNETFLKSPVMQNFFGLYGNVIQRLKLHTASWSNLELWELISEKLPNLHELSVRIFIPKHGHLFPDPEKKPVLPNIKKLNLSFCIVQPDTYFTNPTILKELFLALPNLEVLSCPNWPTIILPSTNVSTLVFNVILSEPEIKFKRLSYLLVTANLSNAELYSLIKKQFPLRELHLELSSEVRGSFFMCFLLSVSDSLETLSLTFPYYYDYWEFETFPILSHLKSLFLHKFQGSLDSIVRNCTGLKKLVLNDVILQKDVLAYNPGNFNRIENKYREAEIFQRDHMLEELAIQDKNDSPMGLIKELTKLFPHLKRLTMQNVNDTVLRTVFATLHQLEELTAQGNFTDSGVTGISEDDCKMLMREDETISFEEADELRAYYHIGSLCKLKRLILESKFITYLSNEYGVKECKNLDFKRISL